jgi:RHS repeat-associated protein
MTSVTQGSTSLWNFTYNALGQRVQWAYPSGADQHLFDPAGNWLGIAGVDSVIPFDGHLWEWYWNGDTYFSHFNNLHSANGVTNHFGTETADALFYPWGQAWEDQENFADLPYYDYKTYDIFAPFRVDSPGIGRWLSPDPLGGDITNPQSLNLYAYVLNNPTSMVDPLGLDGGFSPPGCSSGMPTVECYGGIPGFWSTGFPLQGPGVLQGGGDEFDLLQAGILPGVTQPVGNCPAQYSSCVGLSNGQIAGLSGNTWALGVTPPPGMIPVGPADQLWCPGCYYGPMGSGAIEDQIWDPNDLQTVTIGSGGLAWAPGGLAPMAWGTRVAQAAKTVLQRVRPTVPQALREVPGTAPEIQLEDPFWKVLFKQISRFLGGGGLGPLPPSTVLVPIVSPCAIPSFQNTQMCGGNVY